MAEQQQIRQSEELSEELMLIGQNQLVTLENAALPPSTDATINDIQIFINKKNSFSSPFLSRDARHDQPYERQGADTWVYLVFVIHDNEWYNFVIHYHPYHQDSNWLHAKRSKNQNPEQQVQIMRNNFWYNWLLQQSQNFRNNETLYL